jgi:hypothetical protein
MHYVHDESRPKGAMSRESESVVYVAPGKILDSDATVANDGVPQAGGVA